MKVPSGRVWLTHDSDQRSPLTADEKRTLPIPITLHDSSFPAKLRLTMSRRP